MSLFHLGSSVDTLLQRSRSSHLFITSSISAGTGSSWWLWRPVGTWCDAALSRTVQKIFSSLWQSVGREHLLMATSTSCNLMRIGIWYDLSINSVCLEHEVMREADANETSGELLWGCPS